jgi:stage II sporulation protein D
LINELNLETYLYSVVPSEMPASYEMEALKAQAVCARSYAYRQILENGYANYGAHVDDSVSYQVYNNLQTHENVIRAVNETAGLVLKFGEEVANTYYFSTSCGYTTNETIWKNGMEENSYISGKLLNDSMEKLNLRDEETFREFILNEDYETYDSGEAWYRWDMTVPVKHITETIGSMENIGNVTDIKVIERNDGGVVHRVQVIGTKGTLELTYEHAIRVALNGKDQTIKRTYGKDANGGNMLPSGFFVIDKVEEEGAVKGFRFRGGGFGHGAGMSQNGANHMAEAGKNYEEILGLFYEGTSLTTI